jgi:DNA-binding NarL/FixJ family response regulator
MIRVLIADDHAILRQGLKQIMAETSDMVVMGEAGDGASTVRMVRESLFDVILLDINLPDRNGIDVLQQIKREKPKLQVLMLSMHPEELYAVRSIKAGAAGYLSKQSAPAELVNAVRQVASGRRYVSSKLAEEIANQIGHNADVPAHEQLSHREFQTLCLIGKGRSPTDIALDLSISVKTVSVYRARLLEKMKMRNNAELTRYAIEHRLVE